MWSSEISLTDSTVKFNIKWTASIPDDICIGYLKFNLICVYRKFLIIEIQKKKKNL